MYAAWIKPPKDHANAPQQQDLDGTNLPTFYKLHFIILRAVVHLRHIMTMNQWILIIQGWYSIFSIQNHNLINIKTI